MVARLGKVIFWACTGIAIILIGMSVVAQLSREISVPWPYYRYAFRPEYWPRAWL